MELTELIKYAYDKVPFYKEFYKGKKLDSFDNLPILTKEAIRLNYKKLISEDYSVEDLIEEHTSGSSGEPLTLYKTKKEIIHSNFIMSKFRYRQFGVKYSQKLCYFYMFSRNNNGELTKKPVIESEKVLSLNIFFTEENQLFFYIEKLNNFKPEIILSIPSSLLIVANFILKNNLEVTDSIKLIEVKGEFVTDEQVLVIKQAFCCDVLNHYGCTETYGIAFSCKYGNLHVLKNNVFVEVLDDNLKRVAEGKRGKLYVTALNNKAMPLIRYKLGDDVIYLGDSKYCGCAEHGDCIKILSGRATEYISLPNGFSLNSGIIYYAVDHLNKIFKNGILSFQVIQNTVSDFDVFFVLNDLKINKADMEKMFIYIMIQNGLKNCNWNFEYTAQILPNMQTGKLKYFINKYNKK